MGTGICQYIKFFHWESRIWLVGLEIPNAKKKEQKTKSEKCDCDLDTKLIGKMGLGQNLGWETGFVTPPPPPTSKPSDYVSTSPTVSTLIATKSCHEPT